MIDSATVTTKVKNQINEILSFRNRDDFKISKRHDFWSVLQFLNLNNTLTLEKFQV